MSIIDKSISYKGYYENSEYIYFSNEIINGLFRWDKNNKKMTFIDHFMGYSPMEELLHQNVYEHGGVLFFMPDKSKGIHTYDLSSGKQEYIDILAKSDGRCIDTYRIGNDVYLFFSTCQIKVFNLNNLKLSSLDIDFNVPADLKKASPILWTQFAKQGYDVYGIAWKNSYVVHINLYTYEIEWINYKNEMFSGICIIDNMLYCTAHCTQDLFSYSIGEGKWKVIEVNLLDVEYVNSHMLIYSDIFVKNNKIYMVANRENAVVLMDEHGIQKLIKFSDDMKDISLDKRCNWRRFWGHHVDEVGNVVLLPASANETAVIYSGDNSFTELKYEIDGEWFDSNYEKTFIFPYIEDEIKNGMVLKENDKVSLDSFLKFIEKK